MKVFIFFEYLFLIRCVCDLVSVGVDRARVIEDVALLEGNGNRHEIVRICVTLQGNQSSSGHPGRHQARRRRNLKGAARNRLPEEPPAFAAKYSL
jgi:hypothetical protein